MPPGSRCSTGCPAGPGRAATAAVLRDGWSRPLRPIAGFLLRPWVSVTLFSAVMLAWHLPVLFDLAERNQAVHIWLMHSSFFLAGVLFWLQFIPSPPFQRRMPLVSQAAALIATNVVMWILAMAMSIFSQDSWYSVYAHVPGSPCRRTPTRRSARRSCGSAATSGPSPR